MDVGSRPWCFLSDWNMRPRQTIISYHLLNIISCGVLSEEQRGGALMDCHLLSSDSITQRWGGRKSRPGGGGWVTEILEPPPIWAAISSMTNDPARRRRRRRRCGQLRLCRRISVASNTSDRKQNCTIKDLREKKKQLQVKFKTWNLFNIWVKSDDHTHAVHQHYRLKKEKKSQHVIFLQWIIKERLFYHLSC